MLENAIISRILRILYILPEYLEKIIQSIYKQKNWEIWSLFYPLVYLKSNRISQKPDLPMFVRTF